MTLQEKVQLCVGKSFWQTKEFEKYSIPSFFMCDGPAGLRKQQLGKATDMLGINDSVAATCFPSAVSTANTWNRKLLYQMGKAIGEEACNQNVAVVLGPGINIKRNPLCGRNFEYFSEDPIQSGILAAEFVKGLQSQGIGCSLKHFACNSQETSRLLSDSVIDERALREIYLKAFEIVVKTAEPATVMSAYNKINGVYCSDNKKLLNDVLREQWGFNGLVVTDWGGMNNRIKAFIAGNDLMMPGGSDYMEKDVLEAVKKGDLDEAYIDKCAERIIKMALKAQELFKEEYKADYRKNHQLAVKIAEEGAVLLKNEDDILPLKEDKNILIVGDMAKDVRYQGSGSSHVNPTNLEHPIDYLSSYDYAQGCDINGDTTVELLSDLENKAQKAEAVVVFAGLPSKYESEGFDRKHMMMPEGHIKMIETAAKANKNTVVVLFCGSAVECPWQDNVKGILYMGLPGQGAGQACYNLLFGKANPSGKLSESWPYNYSDVVSADYYAKSRDALYLESIYVGYRYYDKANVDVRWPYGYGLSYSDFKLEDFEMDEYKVKVKVTNTGKYAGSEVVQLYVGQNNPQLHRPLRELKQFEKISLNPDESKEVIFELTDEDFVLWDGSFKKVKGNYRIEIATSSRDICFYKDIEVDGVEISVPDWQKDSWYENCKGNITLENWQKMLGRKYVPVKLVKGQFTMDNSVMEMKDHSLIMKIMYKAVEKVISKGFDGKIDYDNPDFVMLMNSSAGAPLRSMQISGGIKGGIFKGLVEMANGHFIKGLIKMIKG
ncbi:MAG: beta-glucosidase [Erysipelotrichia bacterium]|nr:beta-glucosidase [Erysipelotrichia bacterium]